MDRLMDWIRDLIEEHSIAIALHAFALIVIMLYIAATEHKLELYTVQIDALTKDNTQLELDLVDRDNLIYELQLDLAETEKTLSITANDLDELIAVQQGQEHIALTYAGEYTCTAYCTEKYSHICGGGGNTASGAPVTADVSVATTDFGTFSYGDVIYIEDVGIRIIQDTGGFSKNKLDVAVKTHEEATHWDKQGKHRVWLLEVKE